MGAKRPPASPDGRWRQGSLRASRRGNRQSASSAHPAKALHGCSLATPLMAPSAAASSTPTKTPSLLVSLLALRLRPRATSPCTRCSRTSRIVPRSLLCSRAPSSSSTPVTVPEGGITTMPGAHCRWRHGCWRQRHHVRQPRLHRARHGLRRGFWSDGWSGCCQGARRGRHFQGWPEVLRRRSRGFASS